MKVLSFRTAETVVALRFFAMLDIKSLEGDSMHQFVGSATLSQLGLRGLMVPPHPFFIGSWPPHPPTPPPRQRKECECEGLLSISGL